ncbi:serine hydrolase [Streptomyces sp. NPDC090119]|uniref:serine hydrolase n=1 Tax=Streptomyces sp. NPDC090119 TaxID=3365951 RepID=UPI0038233004
MAELSMAVPEGVRLSVGVLDPGSGRSAVYGDGVHDTASVVKVGILAALLLRAQDAGRTLTAAERERAADMIRRSDNGSATALWHAIGGASGLDTAHHRLGLTATVGGAHGYWGLTRTTARDQLTLLQHVFGPSPVLDAASRAYLVQLMGSVVPEQRWGISAAGPGAPENGCARKDGCALKNGWFPRDATGRWVVHSVGRVSGPDGDRLLAVLTEGTASHAEGVALVESAARAAVRA